MAGEPVQPTIEPPKTVLQFLTEAAERHFKVHHIEGDRFRVAFFTRETATGVPVASESPGVDKAFEGLRVEIKAHSYLPTLRRIGDDGIITVSKIIDPEFRSSRVNWAFFVATLVTVQVSGALLWAGYISPHGPTGAEPGVDWLSLQAMLGGLLYFALPLIAILGLHEMGHFFVARHYHVRASLPFFIPSLPPLGTFGAFISMRDPLPTRKVIFDIGLSGPMVGFLASIAVTVVGTILTQGNPSVPRPESGGNVNLGTPFIFEWIVSAFGTPPSYLHPTLFAGWAGFLVTAFNLIPAAQLDGGHVFFSLLKNGPRREAQAVMVSVLAVVGVAALGSIMGYNGWLLLVLIVLLTIRHPPPLNQISSLGWGRLAAGAIGLVVFAISFAPAPIQLVAADYSFEVTPMEAAVLVPAGGFANYTFTINNTGNAYNDIVVEFYSHDGPFVAGFNGTHVRTSVMTNKLEFEQVNVNATVFALTRERDVQGRVELHFWPSGDPSLVRRVFVYCTSLAAHPSLELNATIPSPVSAGTNVTVPLLLRNTGDVPQNVTLNLSTVLGSWAAGLGVLGNTTFNATVDPGGEVNLSLVVSVPSTAPAGATATYRIGALDESWPGAGDEITVELRVGA